MKLLIYNLLLRIGRKIYMFSRQSEVNNDPENNGEYRLIETLVRFKTKNIIAIDIGGNQGKWSDKLVSEVNKSDKDYRLFIFEPASDSYEFLQFKFKLTKNVDILKIAVSDSKRIQKLYIQGEQSGTNSLLADIDAGRSEDVQTISLSQFIHDIGLDEIDIIKSDTEGNDFKIIQGAVDVFRSQKVKVFQFEYNHKWLFINRSLYDVFNLMSSYNYTIGKLTEAGLLLIETWHPELDRFFESNYVIINEDLNFLIIN